MSICGWLLLAYLVLAALAALWFGYLAWTGQLVAPYPYEDEM